MVPSGALTWWSPGGDLIHCCGCVSPWGGLRSPSEVWVFQNLGKSVMLSASYLGETGPHRATQQFVKMLP